MVGKTLGHYEIIEPLGAGGMGEVYRARDPRLDRDVAIKLLPEDFAADAEQLARFEREAKLLAQLNHTNIAGIYGLEDADGVRFIAMECVEGETIAERLVTHGRIELDDSLDIARQIAEALEAAHEAGIVHRDLKPANVIVAPDGKVKVLDFGLAKAWEAQSGTGTDAAGRDLSHSPTMMEATRTGVILGTAAYMSPEQARGKAVDKRTDIWAFGCVLYEMLTGKRTFSGETVSDTMAAILKEEPDWAPLQGVPPAVQRVLRRCLTKESGGRLHDIADARIEIDAPLTIAEASVASSSSDAKNPPIPALLAAGAAIGAIGATLIMWNILGTPGTVESSRNLALATAADANFGYWYRPVLALSPDGRWLAYVAESAGDPQLFVQDLVTGAPARMIPGTADPEAPFFSPGSDRIAFFQGATLQTVRVDGGEPAELARVGATHPGGAWAEDGSMLVVPIYGDPVQRIDPGGAVTDEVEPQPGELFLYPSSLPGGEHFLVTVNTNSRRSVVAVSWDGSRTPLVEDGYYGRYVSTGHLVWMRDNELVVASFELDTMTVGEPQVVARNMVANRQEGFGEYGVARDGTIAYLEAEPGGEWLQLLRPGQPPETLNSEALNLAYMQFDVSPTGDLVAYSDTNLPPNIHLFDLSRRAPAGVLVTSPNIDFAPVFTWDGTGVAYIEIREDSSWAFYQTTTNSRGEPDTLLTSDTLMWTGSWSPDGETFVFYQEDEDGNTGADLMLLTPASGEDPREFLATPAREDNSLFSADGEWIIYTSDESGRPEIWAISYPSGDRRTMLSTGGGRRATVANDGSIFYNNGEVVMRVELPDPETMEVAPAVEFVRGVDSAQAWDILPDGSGVIAVERRPQPQLRLILGAAGSFPQQR